MKIVKKIGYVNALHRMYIHKEASGKQVYPGQMHMLRYIEKNNSCTQKELAVYLGVTPASTAVSVKRMEKNGLIKRCEDKKDRRIMHLELTDKGRHTIVSLNEAFSKVDDAMFSGFSDAEIVTLDAFLERLCDNLSSEETKEKTICEIVKQIQEFDKRKDEADA